MNCCDEYGNCNQGRDCPVRVAKVKQRPAKYTEGKYVPRQLKALVKWMLLVLIAWLIWVPLLYLDLRA